VALAFAVPTTGSAQTNDELTQRLAELEARLNQMEQEQVSFVNTIAAAPVCATDTCGDTCGSCGDTCCRGRSWCCPEAGAFGEIELLYLTLKDTSDDANQDKYYTGTRVTAGYMNEKGRGLQIRYMEIGITDNDNDRFDLDTLDFEYVSRFSFGCNWRGDISMGLRVADFNNAADEDYADAVGPVLGVSLIGEMTDNLNVYARVRQSFLYGGETDDSEPNDMFPLSEMGFGLEYARCMNSGSEMFVRSGVEAILIESANGDSVDISPVGFAFGVGLRR